MPAPLTSPTDYETFVYDLPSRYPSIERSSLVYIPLGTRIGKVTGMLLPASQRSQPGFYPPPP